MNLSAEHKEAALIFGLVAVTTFLTVPFEKRSRIPKPLVADKKEVTQKDNARIALDAFMTAVENRENSKALNALNNELARIYGLRIYKKGNMYVARDKKGTDILYAK